MSDTSIETNISEALIIIQNDLLNSESVMDVGKKYVAYQEVLKQLFLNALDERVK